MQHIAAFAQPHTVQWQVESSSEEDESDDEDVVVAAPAANGKKVSTAALACCPHACQSPPARAAAFNLTCHCRSRHNQQLLFRQRAERAPALTLTMICTPALTVHCVNSQAAAPVDDDDEEDSSEEESDDEVRPPLQRCSLCTCIRCVASCTSGKCSTYQGVCCSVRTTKSMGSRSSRAAAHSRRSP